MLGTFTQAVNELIFVVGYVVIITSLTYLSGSVVVTLIKRKTDKTLVD